MRLKDNFTGLFVMGHGGECCGIHHINNFPSIYAVELEERVRWIRAACMEAVDDYDDACDCSDCVAERGGLWQCAVEVVLNNHQFEEWEPALLAAGFKQVYEFKNSNTGNTCRVYYFTTGG